MVFDWSFDAPRPGEVLIVDQALSDEAERSFLPRVNVLGFTLGEASLTAWSGVKIVRIPIYDPTSKRAVGQAIRLDNGKEISEAIEIKNAD